MKNHKRQNGHASQWKHQRKQKHIIRSILLTILLLCLGSILLYLYLPNYSMESVHKMLPLLKEDRMNFVYNDEIIQRENSPIEQEGSVYIPVDFVKEYMDPYIYWDEAVSMLTITTENKVIRMRTQDLNYLVNNEPMTLSLPIYQINGIAYMPADLLTELYLVEIHYEEEYKIVVIDSTDTDRNYYTLEKDLVMRYEPHKKSPIEERLTEGVQVRIFPNEQENDENQNAAFVKVRSPKGLIGYINAKDIDELAIVEAVIPESIESHTPNKIDGKIVLLWDQISTVEANLNPSKRTLQPGVNVLCPTWFQFDKEQLDGKIINLADQEYVQWAHKNGIQVWGLLSDNFSSAVSHAVLSNTETRDWVIKQLLAFISIYDLDGINVDFEGVTKEEAANYLQFLRELKPYMQEQGAILSVDLFVPLYTKYYNRAEIAKIADYICVMTYDEHYSGSLNSGPVASLPFVEQGVQDTLEEVPNDQIIMGLPFYVRVWRETLQDGEVAFTTQNLYMESAQKIFDEKTVEWQWLEEIGSYYGEYSSLEDGETVTYKTWLEDARSIEEKMKLFQKYDLAGVSGWSRGMEDPGIWPVIQAYTE